MKKIITEMLKKEIAEYNNLSATYEKPYIQGAVDALESITKRLGSLDLETEFLKSVFEANAQLIARDPMILENILGITLYPEYVGVDASEEGHIEYSCDYGFNYKNERFMLVITNNHEITLLLRQDEDDKIQDNLQEIFSKDIDSLWYSYLTVSNKKYIINLPIELLEEYKNEVISAIEYSQDSNNASTALILFENNRYGFSLNGCKISYKWRESNPQYVELDGHSFVFDGSTESSIKSLYEDTFEGYIKGHKDIDCMVDTFACYGIDIKKSEYRKMAGYGYVKLVDKDVYLAEDALGSNSKKLEYLPENSQMNFLNLLSETLNSPLKFSDFKNDNSRNERSRIIRLLEDENDDSEGTSYLISNLITDWQLKYAFKMTSHVWRGQDDNLSFPEISKSFYEEFSIDLQDIINEGYYDSWYEILENVFTHLNINFKCVETKTFVI